MHSLPGVLDRDEVTFLICIVMLAYQLLEAFPLVAGKNLVLRPAAGIIAFLIFFSLTLISPFFKSFFHSLSLENSGHLGVFEGDEVTLLLLVRVINIFYLIFLVSLFKSDS